MAEVVELVLDELPEKKGDPGSISIPCQFGNILATQALTDSGASINLMPFSFLKKFNLPDPKPINMKIHLADKTISRPRGVCEDLLIKVDKFVFPVDFVVLDMDEDPKIPIILGRPFLNTAWALIDVCKSTLTLRVGDESAVFKAIQEVKQEESREEEISSIDLDDEILEKELALLQKDDPNKFLLSSGGNGDAEKDLEEIEKLLKGTNSEKSVEKDPAAEGVIVKMYCEFQKAQVAYLDMVIQGDEEMRLDKEEGEVQKKVPKSGVKKKKDGKRNTHAIEEDGTRKKKEELRRAYNRNAYKTKYKPQKIRRAFPMQESEET
ncbi:uncharacterized protein LOC111878458 [Lactuca sativa]|uniref:uncharacterized protein LOC111878458 n=1 Tax=Lactuca sativa TaxID=4236 RepID=UPI000CD8F0D9|nr:uncharacterized protein LOC111878458 [Lactuca sativa]